jgi:hypothetical protein
MLYQLPEGSLTLNGVWRDKTVNILMPEEVAVKGVNLVVARDALTPEVSFGDYIATQRQNFQKELAGLTILLDQGGAIDERPAHFLEFTWTNQGRRMHQMVMAINDQGRLVNFTASIPGSVDADLRAFLLDAIRSFKFRTAPGGSPA